MKGTERTKDNKEKGKEKGREDKDKKRGNNKIIP